MRQLLSQPLSEARSKLFSQPISQEVRHLWDYKCNSNWDSASVNMWVIKSASESRNVWPSIWLSEHLSDCLTGWVCLTVCLNELVSDWVSHCVSKYITGWVSDRIGGGGGGGGDECLNGWVSVYLCSKHQAGFKSECLWLSDCEWVTGWLSVWLDEWVCMTGEWVTQLVSAWLNAWVPE